MRTLPVIWPLLVALLASVVGMAPAPAHAAVRAERDRLYFEGYGCGHEAVRVIRVDRNARAIRVKRPKVGQTLKSEGLTVARITDISRSEFNKNIRVTATGAGDICGDGFRPNERWRAEVRGVVRYRLKTFLVGRHRVGPLLLGRSREKAVRRAFGAPGYVRRFRTAYNRSRQRRGKYLGYDCRKETQYGYTFTRCQTYFTINLKTLRLTDFSTSDSRFQTARGTHPGMRTREAKAREPRFRRTSRCGRGTQFQTRDGVWIDMWAGKVRGLIRYLPNQTPEGEPLGC